MTDTIPTPSKKRKIVNPRSKRPDNIIPMGDQRDKLTVRGLDPKLWSTRWFKDTGDSGFKIVAAENAGWSFVYSDEVTGIGNEQIFESEYAGGSVIRRPGDPKTTGEFIYLMKIPKKWFDEAQKAKQEIVNETERAMYEATNPEGSGTEGSYAPKGYRKGINIKR